MLFKQDSLVSLRKGAYFYAVVYVIGVRNAIFAIDNRQAKYYEQHYIILLNILNEVRWVVCTLELVFCNVEELLIIFDRILRDDAYY